MITKADTHLVSYQELQKHGFEDDELNTTQGILPLLQAKYHISQFDCERFQAFPFIFLSHNVVVRYQRTE